MRVAFSIILNGLRHLKAMGQAESISKNFDYWVIVEGASNNSGSTAWCREALSSYHDNGHSIDGTNGFLRAFVSSADNVRMIQKEGLWDSKDDMVNAATRYISGHLYEEPVYLWEVDIDEYWTLDDIRAAEKDLDKAGAKTGMFLADFYVGTGLVVRGGWGEGKVLPYNRLWAWNGEQFEKHEPPVLKGGNDPAVMLPQRFKHLSYFFEEDVRFKDAWYGGHSGILKNWEKINSLPRSSFPLPVTDLIPFKWGKNGDIETKIHNIE